MFFHIPVDRRRVVGNFDKEFVLLWVSKLILFIGISSSSIFLTKDVTDVKDLYFSVFAAGFLFLLPSKTFSTKYQLHRTNLNSNSL